MTAMFVTVTPNPSVDRTIGVRRVERGGVHRGTSTRIDPGGKGVNVARALAANDAKAAAVLPLGGAEGILLAELLDRCGLEVLGVPIAEPIRANVTITEPDGTTTKFNEPGPTYSAGEQAALLDCVHRALLRAPSWLVGCGSLPGGLGHDFYARLVEAGHRHNVPVAVDTSGPALLEAARAGADLMKPNLQELADARGQSLRTVGDAVDAARWLLELGAESRANAGYEAVNGDSVLVCDSAVVVSLGRHGAILVRAEHSPVQATAVVREPRSTVGAGDALLAGYLHTEANGAGPAGDRAVAALSTAVAWGTAAVALPGSRMPTPDDVARVQVSVDPSPDPDLPIHD